jgi:hypothetical protein
MSSNHHQYFTSADPNMLDGVLVEAGMRNYRSAAKQAVRADAAKYLIARFQEGARSPSLLTRELRERSTVSAQGDENASTGPFAAYQYGKRVEVDRTWTIVHVFTGKMVRRDGWPMKGLTARGAERVLRTLNTPTSHS